MLRVKRAATAALLVALAACSGGDALLGPSAGGPRATISDAAHGGNPGFYFLPPMVANPSYSGVFDPNQPAEVEICELAGPVCGPVLVTYTTTTGQGSERVRVTDGKYQVNWHGNQFNLDPAKFYRITVRVGSFVLGYADVDVVKNGKDEKNVDPSLYVAMKQNQTLPIKFRIEVGAVNPNTPPVAVPDAFDAIGNVTVPVSAPGVLANDTDAELDALSATAGTFPTAQGGTVTLNADGSFTYLSPAGFTGSDSFTYTVSDGDDSAVGSVTLTVATRVWYVRNDATAPGDGRDASPFTELSSAEAASLAGETIFVLAGDGSSTGLDDGITLKAGQALVGQGIPAAVTVSLNGETVTLLAPGSAPALARTGAGTTVQLATNNTVRGVDVTSSAGAGIAGLAFGTFSADNVAVAATGGAALALSGGSVAATFDALSSSASTGDGISLAAVAGALSVTGDGVTAASGGTVQGAAGDAVSISGSVSAALRLMRLLPTGDGLVAIGASGTIVLERSVIDYLGTAPAGSFGVRFANLAGGGSLVLDGTAVQNKLDGTAAVSVSGQGSANLSFSMVDSNTGDAFPSTLTNLFGSGVVASAGDTPGSTAHVTARVSDTRFLNAAANGINNLELAAGESGVIDFVVRDNLFDGVAKASAIVGVINLNVTGQGRAGSSISLDSIVGNTIQNIGTGSLVAQLGYVGIRVAIDNPVAGINHRVVIEDNDVRNVWRQGLLVSGRGNADDINVRVAGNTIGTAAAPVARSNRRGVEIETQSNSTVKIEVLNNPSIVNTSTSGTNSALHLRSTGSTSTIAAAVRGNGVGNTNAGINPGRFRAETLAGTTAGMCLELQSNTLDGAAKLFELNHASTGVYQVRGPGAAVVTGADVTAMNTVGTGSVTGAPTFNGNAACAAPAL